MLPAERQHRIMERIQSEKHIKIAELSRDFGVSEMTIHRDTRPLVEEGLIIKTFGGISHNVDTGKKTGTKEKCVCCQRQINEHLSCVLTMSTNELEFACCPHCGLMRYRQREEDIIQIVTHDFLRHTTINALTATYVAETSLSLNCCEPQLLPFEKKDHAEKFVHGFGGITQSFSEAVDYVHARMGANNAND